MKPWRWGALTAAKQRCEFGLTAQNAASSDRHSHLINAHISGNVIVLHCLPGAIINARDPVIAINPAAMA